MPIKRIILLYLIILFNVIGTFPTISLSYSNLDSSEVLTQYIIGLSKNIYSCIYPMPASDLLSASKGKLKLKVKLSPWGELKDAYIEESSGSDEIDNLCLKAVWSNERFEPFPEYLGEEERWIEVPIIFDTKPKRAGPVNKTAIASEQGAKKEQGQNAQNSEGLAIDYEYFFTPQKTEKSIKILGVEDAFDMALEDHMPLKIAKDEIDLSRLKMKEAKRALFPTASLNYLETTGKTTQQTQDFTDKEYKLKFEYPLYYGWRLKYAIEQSRVNIKASQENYEKIIQELRGEVEAAFYAYMVKKANLKLQKELFQEIKKVYDVAKKRYELELSTPSEFLQVQSQMEQVSYQAASSENELKIAKITLQQAMNLGEHEELKDIFDANINMDDFKPVSIDVSLERCMELALKYRPDLKAKLYTLEFNEYENKIQKSKEQLRVDLTGSYGRSGGAFESETLNLATDWYLGLKVTKPLGANTLSSAITKEQTTEKHGQTSRTESFSRSLELGIADNLQHFSEKKSSEISIKKAKDELNQIKESIFKEINETYLNYTKELMQVASSSTKIKYKEEELKLAKVRSDLNEVPASQLIQAYMSLADEKAFYVEAVGSLYQSISKLDKATGYALFTKDESIKVAQAENK